MSENISVQAQPPEDMDAYGADSIKMLKGLEAVR